MVSRIFNGISNAVSKVAEFVSPKQGQKIGLITDAAAVVATAVAATVSPIFAFQLAGTYMLGRHIHNTEVEENPMPQFTFASEAQLRKAPNNPVSIAAPRIESAARAVRLIDDEGPTALDMLRADRNLTEYEKMQIIQNSPEVYGHHGF